MGLLLLGDRKRGGVFVRENGRSGTEEGIAVAQNSHMQKLGLVANFWCETFTQISLTVLVNFQTLE